jgi:uncharacterized CHY-type Zn-finger protein
MKSYTVYDVVKAEHNLEPLECIYCHSNEVIYDQYVRDGYCGNCGSWQFEPMDILKESAEESLEFRGHELDEWEYINDHTSRMVCPVCQAQVTVNTRPLPNEIDIGGAAVALTCED